MGYGKACGVGGAIVGTGSLGFIGGVAFAASAPVSLPLLGFIGAVGAAGTAVGAGIGAFAKFLFD